MLHLRNNEESPERLNKVKTVLDQIKIKYKTHFSSSQNLVTDENMVLLKGRLIFKH
ncbi:hypothetical protein WN55_07970 [Dufourea novaeangliae]|uniref:PiggyBac transposable element-derived protein domain-containing protein n=1 Tax=Dufourea novaeangliae TaxID=178035 RepID=A0A154PUP1_DUFNO|nr:hypothetical protein WN55_07970 [Dufourea novaeangliae]